MSDLTNGVVHTGGCLCGAVRYEVTGAPMMSAFCYCQMCRKLSGSGHAFHAMVAEDTFRVSGTVKGYTSTADSGNKVMTEFCPTCGSPLFGRSSGYPGMVTVRVASLDEPSAIDPQVAVFTNRRLKWDRDLPSLPSFPEMPPLRKQA